MSILAMDSRWIFSHLHLRRIIQLPSIFQRLLTLTWKAKTMEKIIFNDHVKINHPLANRVSVQDSEYHQCTPGVSSEIAFFIGKKFQTQVIEEFAGYADGLEGDTLVYSWVPNEIIERFLEVYRA